MVHPRRHGGRGLLYLRAAWHLRLCQSQPYRSLRTGRGRPFQGDGRVEQQLDAGDARPVEYLTQTEARPSTAAGALKVLLSGPERRPEFGVFSTQAGSHGHSPQQPLPKCRLASFAALAYHASGNGHRFPVRDHSQRH
ncbi:hypothetical protein AGR8A_pAt20117 [Agrobacterium fabrum str. J-07]|nr:hypothetical protein AGR8A_pAt20117 [Agrobacterium fabrum str. J-07]